MEVVWIVARGYKVELRPMFTKTDSGAVVLALRIESRSVGCLASKKTNCQISFFNSFVLDSLRVDADTLR